jgi:hypothetical protein
MTNAEPRINWRGDRHLGRKVDAAITKVIPDLDSRRLGYLRAGGALGFENLIVLRAASDRAESGASRAGRLADADLPPEKPRGREQFLASADGAQWR